MADDRVDIVFGAELGDLVAGVQEVSAQVGSLTAPVAELSQRFGAAWSEIDSASTTSSRKAAQQWQEALNIIDRSLDTMLKGVLEGTQTWQQAMGRLFDNLALAFIEAVVKMMVQWAAFEALQGLGFGAAASAIGNPFVGGGLGGLVGSIGSGIGSIIGLDGGAWSVPSDMLAVVHEGEMVLPADLAALARGGGAVAPVSGGAASAAAPGGSFALNVSVQAMDAAGVAQWANANAKTLAATIARYMGNNSGARGDF